MNQRFSAKDFVAVLNKGELLERPLIKQGMVKPSEKKDALLFNEGTECGQWVHVPLDCIEEIEHLDTIACKDHKHPYVEITFKRPKDDNPLAKVFMGLASREFVPEAMISNQHSFGKAHHNNRRCHVACKICFMKGHPGACAICEKCPDYDY